MGTIRHSTVKVFYSCLQLMTYFLFRYTSFVNLSRMATAYPQATEHGDDNFVLELNREKDKVRTRFIELREILTETENKLMKALNDILSSYNSYQTEVKRMNEQKLDFENIRKKNMTAVPTLPAVRTFHEKFLQDLNEQLKQLRTPVKPKLVSFVCDKEKLLIEVNELCKLVERVSEIDYKSKTQSIISVCDEGTGNEQLNYPWGVTVNHDTGNIYVADLRTDSSAQLMSYTGVFTSLSTSLHSQLTSIRLSLATLRSTTSPYRICLSYSGLMSSWTLSRGQGGFTFQVQLRPSGEITFVYKKAPLTVKQTNKGAYTSLSGLADGFILNNAGILYLYSYHNVTLPDTKNLTRSVYVLTPLPNCVTATDAISCNATSCLSSFECGWCEDLGLCSDGIDRMRQQWYNAACHNSAIFYCSPVVADISTSPAVVVGIVFVLLLVITPLVILLTALLVYAVYKYRKGGKFWIISSQVTPRRSDQIILSDADDAKTS